MAHLRNSQPGSTLSIGATLCASRPDQGHAGHLRPYHRPTRRAGATLIEISICIVIVGTGVAALMQFMGSATSVNRNNTQTSMAIQHARAGWEIAVGEGFAKVMTWTTKQPTQPPEQTFPATGYERRIWVENVNIDDISGAASTAVISDKLRVNVEILFNNVLVYKQRWILTKP